MGSAAYTLGDRAGFSVTSSEPEVKRLRRKIKNTELAHGDFLKWLIIHGYSDVIKEFANRFPEAL